MIILLFLVWMCAGAGASMYFSNITISSTFCAGTRLRTLDWCVCHIHRQKRETNTQDRQTDSHPDSTLVCLSVDWCVCQSGWLTVCLSICLYVLCMSLCLSMCVSESTRYCLLVNACVVFLTCGFLFFFVLLCACVSLFSVVVFVY